jgi:hypothetical protein
VVSTTNGGFAPTFLAGFYRYSMPDWEKQPEEKYTLADTDKRLILGIIDLRRRYGHLDAYIPALEKELEEVRKLKGGEVLSEDASRKSRRAEIARDALSAFTDEQLREMGGDPDDLRRRVREAGLAREKPS